jgi:hypothetical protein
MKDNESVFPIFDSRNGNADYQIFDNGMTLPQYAAIHLRVPRSGDPDIDAMIRKNRRADFMGQAMRVFLGKALDAGGIEQTRSGSNQCAKDSLMAVDAMLAEWEKEAVDEKGD